MVVQLANDVLAEKPAVILGSSLVAMCAAIAPLMQNGPVDYCLSPAYHRLRRELRLLVRRSAIDQSAAVVRYYRLKGWARIAALATRMRPARRMTRRSTKSGPAREQGMTLTERQHFNPTDLSVTAQFERIRASGAQAIIAGVTGTPAATVFKGMVQAGLDIPIAVTSGNQSFPQMEQWAISYPTGL